MQDRTTFFNCPSLLHTSSNGELGCDANWLVEPCQVVIPEFDSEKCKTRLIVSIDCAWMIKNAYAIVCIWNTNPLVPALCSTMKVLIFHHVITHKSTLHGQRKEMGESGLPWTPWARQAPNWGLEWKRAKQRNTLIASEYGDALHQRQPPTLGYKTSKAVFTYMPNTTWTQSK